MADTVAPAGITIRDLLDAGLHFGHQTKRWNPKMKRYIFDKRNGIHIIDLTKSLALLQQALKFVNDIVASGKAVLFVGTKKQAQQVVFDAAKACNQPYVTTRWLGGTLTNAETIRKSIKHMREVEAIVKGEGFASMHKKEASRLRNELEKLQRNLTGIAGMADLPGAVIVMDINREAIAVKEANRLKIPVIAIVDTNTDPDPINYPIPGNDDSIRTIKLISNAIAATVKTAAEHYAQIAAEIARKREAERAERAAAEEAARKVAAEKAKEEKAEKASRKRSTKEAAADKVEDKDKAAEKTEKKPAAEKKPAKTTKTAKPADEKKETEAPKEPAKHAEHAAKKEPEKKAEAHKEPAKHAEHAAKKETEKKAE